MPVREGFSPTPSMVTSDPEGQPPRPRGTRPMRGPRGRRRRGRRASDRPRDRLSIPATQRNAERRERALRMVSCGRVLRNLGSAPGHQTGQEDRALHLGARDVRRKGNALQVTAGDGQRRPIAFSGIHPGPHEGQRRHDAAHRPAGKRAIAGERRHKRVSRDHARQHPHRAAGISAVECLPGRREAGAAATLDLTSGEPSAAV